MNGRRSDVDSSRKRTLRYGALGAYLDVHLLTTSCSPESNTEHDISYFEPPFAAPTPFECPFSGPLRPSFLVRSPRSRLTDWAQSQVEAYSAVFRRRVFSSGARLSREM